VILEAELPRDARAAFQARALVASFRCGLSVLQLADAMLAVSELVARAYRGGEGPITLRLESPGSGVLRADIGDEAKAFNGAPDEDLGLEIVGATTDDWGVEDDGGRAWFQIGVARTSSAQGAGRAGS
jgi:hypothetical protein